MLLGDPETSGAPALFWPAALVIWGPGSRSDLHAHHAVQLVVALEGRLQVRANATDAWREAEAVVVAADAPHAIDANGHPVLMAFMDPEAGLGKSLQGDRDSVHEVPSATVARWREALGVPDAIRAETVEAWLRREWPTTAPVKMHPRVRRVLRHLRERLSEMEHVSLEQLAEVAGLSPSRLMHVFTESVGVPLRPYVLWLRVQRAALELSRGARIGDAAHAAGFADAAHLSRTLRRTLGATPRELVNRSANARAFGRT